MTKQSTEKKYPNKKPFVKNTTAKKAAPKAKAVKKPVKTVIKEAPKAKPQDTFGGFVAILGAPNAGKSTLLNRLVGEKISIVSPKAQTTRMRVMGVLTEGKIQAGLIDTPGIFTASRRLDQAMVKAAWNSLQDADVIVLLVDASTKLDDRTEMIVDELRRREKRIVVALNKLDKISPAEMLPLAQRLNDSNIVDDVFMISALNGDGVHDLKKHVMKKMPSGPWFFDADQLSDTPTQIMAAEVTREQLYRQLQQELPYGATVIPESWEPKKDGSVVIRQSIVVARANHRPIVLGAGGARIKSISQAARHEMTKMLGHPVHLFLEVKIDEKWQDKAEFYSMFGLEFAKK